MIDEAEVIGTPCIVAREIGMRLYRTGGRRGFAGTLAANDQGLATNRDEDLWGAVRHRVGNDIGTKHLHVPMSQVLWALAHDVDVIKFECWIAHCCCSSCQQARL